MSARVLTLLAVLVCTAGCQIGFHGSRIAKDKIDSVHIGTTTEGEVRRLFGEPDTVVQKRAEKVTVYQYKFIRSLSVGLPFFVSVGRPTQTGRMLNIIIKDGKVADVEETEIDDPFFWRRGSSGAAR